MTTALLIEPAQVQRIVDMDDRPELRNLLITQSYHDLSLTMAELLGQDNCNWCTFACWASRTAGRFIRDEELPAAFRGLVRQSSSLPAHGDRLQSTLSGLDPSTSIELDVQGLFGLVGKMTEDVSTYIMAGNKVVYAELGLLFARFIEAFRGASAPDPAKLQALVESYAIGEVRPDEVEIGPGRAFDFRRVGGQSMLRELLTLYHQAMFESDPHRKAELILLGNAQGGLHEQTRLQTYIAGSMDAPIEDLAAERAHAAVREKVSDLDLRHRAHVAVDRLVHPLAAELRHLWEEFSTVAMMEMKLPDSILRLGQDIPAMAGRPLFPAPLAEIANTELRTVLDQYGALRARSTAIGWRDRLQVLGSRVGLLPPAALGSAATDWVSFSQRMRYIFELFRARQIDRTLFDQPFSDAQRQRILAGEVPEGPLY